jgi:hypothetical protein
LSGNVLVIVSDIRQNLTDTTSGKQPLSPFNVSLVDRRLDDGLPASGFIQAYGDSASCFQGPNATDDVPQYDPTVSSKDCGFFYTITE